MGVVLGLRLVDDETFVFLNRDLEVILLDVLRNLFTSFLDWCVFSKKLLHLLNLERLENLTFGLEYQKIGLLFNVDHVIFKEEVIVGLGYHSLDQLGCLL